MAAAVKRKAPFRLNRPVQDCPMCKGVAAETCLRCKGSGKRNRHHWTADDDRIVTEGHANGDPVTLIAARIGTTKRAIHHRAQILGVKHVDTTHNDLQAKIFDRSIPVPWSGCWLWTGALKADGYALTRLGSPGAAGSGPAHRISYRVFKGEIPDGLEIDHLCRVRSCVNPDHLEAVSKHENWRRSQAPSAKAALRNACIHGHPYSPDNVYYGKGGDRCCKICIITRNKSVRKMAAKATA